jgi:multidrug efflux pump subunit AcrB
MSSELIIGNIVIAAIVFIVAMRHKHDSAIVKGMYVFTFTGWSLVVGVYIVATLVLIAAFVGMLFVIGSIPTFIDWLFSKLKPRT